MSKMYHATHTKNLPGIERCGLVAAMCSGKRPSVWGVVRSKIDYAVWHCLSKRKWALQDIVILECQVPSKWLRKHSPLGAVYTVRDVPPERIRVYARTGLIRE